LLTRWFPTPSDQNFSYVRGPKGYHKKIRKYVCYLCPKEVDFIAIFYGNGYKRKERFCKEYAESDGPLPLLVPEIN